MTEERKRKIIGDLMEVYNNFDAEETKDDPMFHPGIDEPVMYWLIVTYTETGRNTERVGGSWVVENCPEPLRSLPQ